MTGSRNDLDVSQEMSDQRLELDRTAEQAGEKTSESGAEDHR